MFNRELDCYKRGLSGHKPSLFTPDSPARRAKQRGYEQYLANNDLAEQLAQANEADQDESYGSSDYATSPPTPTTWWQALTMLAISLVIPFTILFPSGAALIKGGIHHNVLLLVLPGAFLCLMGLFLLIFGVQVMVNAIKDRIGVIAVENQSDSSGCSESSYRSAPPKPVPLRRRIIYGAVLLLAFLSLVMFGIRWQRNRSPIKATKNITSLAQ